MDLKSSLGICAMDQGPEGKLVVIPQDADMFEENQVVVLVSASDFESFTDEMKVLIKLVKSAKTVSQD